jgi:hypothetical protein
MRPQVTQK